MLEKYVASLLVPYLSKYVKNIDERQLSIDIWSGKATLNDLVLKEDVLNTILGSEINAAVAAAAAEGSGSGGEGGAAGKPLPVRVHRGVCKSVTLDIPLTNLRSRPVVVNIGEILITLVAPDMQGGAHDAANTQQDGTSAQNPKSHRWDRVAAQKARELDAFEEDRRKQREEAAAAAVAEAAAKESGNANSPKKGGFFSKLGEIVINNIIVKAKAVHIRYEDAMHRVVLGAVLGGVQLLTIDDVTGEATFVDPSHLRRLGKRLELEGLQVYCDDPKHMLVNESIGRCWLSQIAEWQPWYHAMRQRSRDGNVALSTVLGPVTCSVDTRIVFKQFVRQMLETPYMTVTAQLQHVIAHLTRAQYTTIVKSISRFTNWSEVAEVAARRPRVPVKGHAKVWWRFAIHTVREVLREPREARVLHRISEICRMDYQVLYRDVVRKTEMSPEKRRSYRFITRFMTVEDMIAGRKHVYAQLANEIQLRRKDIETRRAEAAAALLQQHSQPQSPVAPPPPPKRGWFQWLRGSSDSGATEGGGGPNAHLSPEEREEEAFFRALEKDYGVTAGDAGGGDNGNDDENSSPLASPTQLPPGYTWLLLSLDLPFMSFQIDMEDGESACLSFFQLYGQARSFNKTSSVHLHFGVQNLTLSNPAAGFEGGEMISNLIEGMAIPRSASDSSSSAPSSAHSRSAQVRSITDVDNGKLRPDRAPTLREMLGLAPGSAFNNGSSDYSQHQHGHTSSGLSSTGPPGGGGAGAGALASASPSSAAYATPLLSLSGALYPVEQPLADTRLDAAVCVKLLPLRVVADPGTIRRIVHFFRVPKGVDLSHFTQSATSAASAVSTAASQELRTAMASAKGLFLSIDASAPIILLPKTLRATRQETTLAVSLGRIRFQTQPLSETEKANRLSSTNETEEMLYYSNRASFSKFFVELTTLEDALHHPESGMMIIPNLAIAADVLQRIDDRSDCREKIIVRLKVPKLTVAASVHQVYLLTNMIDGWIHNWATGASSSALEQTRQKSEGYAGSGCGDDDDAELIGGGHTSLSESLVMSQRADFGGGSPVPQFSSGGGGGGGAGPSQQRGYSPTLHSGSGAGNQNTVGGSSSGGGAGGGTGSSALAAGRRTVVGLGADSVGVSTSSSPSTTPLVVRQEDLPICRIELLVETLGLEVHEDDPEDLRPIFPPRFSLCFANAEFIMAIRTTLKKIIVYLKEPCARDIKDPTHPILHGTSALRIDVGLAPDAPVAVGVVIEPSLRARVGTPLIELVETLMDVVNLTMSCIDGAEEPSGKNSSTVPLPLTTPQPASPPFTLFRTARQGDGSSGGAAGQASPDDTMELPETNELDAISGIGVSPTGGLLLSAEEANRQMQYLQQRKTVLSDLAYQLGLVRLQNATPDTRTANVSIHIDGTATVDLFNRCSGEEADQLFASASVTGVSLFVKKNTVTMEVTGKVAEARATLAESHGLLPANNTILSHTLPTPGHFHSRQVSADDGATTSAKKGVSGEEGKERPPHISLTYRKSRPVMPIFVTQAEGKRVLTNASELRYSSAVELELGCSTVTLDVHTVMLLKLYFATGFFSRLSLLGDRPVYNGRRLPPTRDGPLLLMSMRVVARDITVALPLDARRTAETFSATVGNLVVQSSLHAWEAQQTTSISLRELALWRDSTEGGAHCLLPTQAYVEVAMRSPIDLESDEDARLDVKSEDLILDITSADLLDLCQLLRQNASRAAVDPASSVAIHPIKRVFVRPSQNQGYSPMATTIAAGGGSPGPDGGDGSGGSFSATSAPTNAGPQNDDMIIGVRFGHVALRFSGDGASFELSATGCGLLMDYHTYAVSLNWKSLELLDTRSGTTSALIRCDEGEAYMADSLTTQAIVMADFGVRPSVNAKGPEDTSTIAADEEDASSRVGRPGGDGGGGLDSIASSDVTATPNQALPNRSMLTAAETGMDSSTGTGTGGGGGGGGGGGLPRRGRRPSTVGGRAHCSAAAAPGRELISMSVLSVAFTLRRFAVSDQWLSIYDYFCNEAVAAAWAAPQAQLPDDVSRTAPTGGAGQQEGKEKDEATEATRSSSGGGGCGGFRCVVTTPSVVVPFLTASREPLLEAIISSLLIDTVSFPAAGTQVAVKVQELEVVDCKSGEHIVTRRRRATGGASEAGADNDDDYYYSPDDEEEVDSPLTRSPYHQQQQHGFEGLPRAPLTVSYTNTGVVGNSTGIHAHGTSGKEGKVPKEPEALNFLFKADPSAHKNKVFLSMGRLDAVCSIPLLYGLMDYFLSPTQPIARIADLGVMKEQRERVARAAQEMTDKNVMSIQVLWHQPRIVLVGDGVDLTNHARRLEARLGTMRAGISLDKPNESLVTTVKVRDFSIPTLLEKSALSVVYSAKRGREEVQVTLDRMVGLFFPADVEQLVYVIYGNLMLPRETYYYGRFDTAEDVAAVATRQSTTGPLHTDASAADVASIASGASTSITSTDASPSSLVGGEGGRVKKKKRNPVAKPSPKPSEAPLGGTPPPPPVPTRTITVQINGLMVEVHDFVGINTHTITLTSLSLTVNPAGDISLVIPAIAAVEHFTNCAILSSGETDAAGVRVARDKPARRVGLPSSSSSSPASPLSPLPLPSSSPPPPPAKPAIALTMEKATGVTSLAMSEVVFALVPRGTGVLANILLSVHIPQVDIAAAAVAAAKEKADMESAEQSTGAQDLGDSFDLLSGNFSLGSARPIEAPIPPSRIEAADEKSGNSKGGKTTAQKGKKAAPVRSFKATLDGCGLRFVHNEANVAFAKFARVAVAMETYKDDSSLMYATVEDFTLVDSYSANPTTRQIIARYVDDDLDLSATSSRADAARRKLLDFTLWTAPPTDKLSRTISISSLRRENNLYAKRVKCEVANLSFTLVPDVVKALAGTVSEVMQHVSEVNRGKAYEYVSDTATAAAEAVTSKTTMDLTELEVIIHRPRFVLLHRADAESGIELYPGRLTVQSELGLPEASPDSTDTATTATTTATKGKPATPARSKAPPSPMNDLYRETFRVRIERMGVRMLDDDAFKKDCQISMLYQTSLPAPPSLEQLLAEVRMEMVKDGFRMPPLSPGDGGAASAPRTPSTASADTPSRAAAVATTTAGGYELKPATAAATYREESEVRVSIPSMAMNLSDTQTAFLMDILGAFMSSDTIRKRDAGKQDTPPFSSGASAVSNTVSSFGAGVPNSALDTKRRPGGAAHPAGSPFFSSGGSSTGASPSMGGARSQPARSAMAAVGSGGSGGDQRVVMRRKPAANPHAVFRMDLYIGHVEADLAELFRLNVESAEYRSQASEASGSHTVVKVKSLVLQHVGAQVEVADASTGERHSTRIDELVELLTVNSLLIDSASPPLVMDEDALSTSTETMMNMKAETFRVAVSPTILFDTREVLYLPFCAKVLHQPIEPVPALKLQDEMTRLTEDVTLDGMNVLLTCNRKRCCYHLDLNGYTLTFTGQPSGQIVLSEGCELTISNGTIVIPGLYSIGSYVSYAAATALFTTDTCTVEKRYQNISNVGFAVHSDAMKASASAALASHGGNGPRASGAGALPSPGAYRTDGGIPIQQRSARLVVDFSCPQVVLQVLSEEMSDLSASICMEANVAFTQDSENDVAVRRNLQAQLLEVRSGHNEPHILLPTTIAANFSGVENASVVVVFGPLEMCSRAVLMRSFVEIAKDFGAAFIEETTIKRFKPTTQLETTEFVPLLSVASAGQCQHCGQYNAYLSENANTPGTLCYKCCTGRESMPATDFRVEIPLIDAVLLAASGDVGHAYIQDVILCVDPNMDVQLSLHGALHNFSNAAAVWEPFVEQLDCSMRGSVYSHDYSIRIDRFDYVISPLNIHLLSTLSSDYASSTTLQKRMRKKFRRQTQQRADMTCYNTAPMYVQEVAGDEDDRALDRVVEVDDELSFGSTLRGTAGAGGGLSNMSIFDVLSIANKRSINNDIPSGYEDAVAPAPGAVAAKAEGTRTRPYAQVEVENCCNATFLVEGRPVSPRGGTLRMEAPKQEILIARETPYDATDKGYVLSLANPALYLQANDFLMETKVVLSRDEASRSLRRVVSIKVLPLHGSKTLICVENRLSCWLSPGGNIQDMAPGDRYYVRAVSDLSAPLVVRPTKMDSGLSYAPGVTEEGKTITIQEVLTGLPVSLICRPDRQGPGAAPSAAAAAKKRSTAADGGNDGTIYARVMVRQDAMRGGIPSFTISVEPRYRLNNKLPYSVCVSVVRDEGGGVAKGRVKPGPAMPPLVVEAMDKVELGTGTLGIESVAITLEVEQPIMDGRGQAGKQQQQPSTTAATGKRTSAPLSAGSGGKPSLPPAPRAPTERFTSVPVAVKNGFVKLMSSSGRQLTVRIIVSQGNILLMTPFVMVNHSDYPLQIRECNKKGEVQRVDAECNFSVLAPNMSWCVAACPIAADKEEFFVNVYSDKYSAKAVPFHVQQRGLILMEELLSPAQAAAAAKERERKKARKGGTLGGDVPEHAMLHLAYISKVVTSGAVLVTITPRWIVVNRSPRIPLFFAPTMQVGMTATEAHAAARAQVAAENADKSSQVATPTTSQKEVDAFTSAILGLSAGTEHRLTDFTYVVPVGPKTAEPLYLTPYCVPEIGYHSHILQSPEGPLYGNPVSLETIHNEVIVSYHERTNHTGEPDDDDDGGGNPLQGEGQGKARRVKMCQRDHFLEVSLVSQESYTYVIVDEPEVFPFILLNRTRYGIELRDTAPKSAGRLVARAPPGCGSELIIDSTVTTTVRVVPTEARRSFPGVANGDSVCFDVGRPMSAAERAAAKGGLLYQVTYGELGQTVVEIYEATPLDTRALTSRASPPTPLNMLLNMAVLTISVVIPNRDILFAAITDTRISWDRAQHKEEVQFSLKNFQVDNQTEISPRYDSCLLALRKSEGGAAVSGSFKRTIIAAKALLWFDEVRLDITPIALRVSDTLLVTLARFMRILQEEGGSAGGEMGGAAPAAPAASSPASMLTYAKGLEALSARHKCPTKQSLFEAAPRQMDLMATRIVLDKLIVNPLLIRLWLTRDNDESDFFRDGLHTKEASLLSMMVPSCEDVNVSAPGLVAIRRSSRLGVLLQWIAKSYTDVLFAQLQAVLLQYAASLPFIGAPVKLFSGIGSGAVRLFREPVEGLATSPKAFAQGLARGSSGFAAGFAGGGLGAFANLANAGSRLLSMGGGVSEKERRKQNTWTGITSGLAGIVQRPAEGAAESGASGFAKGAAHGLVGVLANPLSGLLSDVSRATGTMAKLVTDTYIPQTKRLRPIRPFHANGGVAQWRSVITIYQYERVNRGSGTWSSSALLSGVDGPEWFPCKREVATYGKDKKPVPPDAWALDRHNTSFLGWTFSTKYYGYYTGMYSDEVRVRRKRWTALVRPLPYSPMAFYLAISPGMAREPQLRGGPRGGLSARTDSVGGDLDPADLNRQTTSATLDYVQPGALSATTVQEAKARRNPFRRHRRSRSREGSADAAVGHVMIGGRGGSRPPQIGRTNSGFFDDEEYTDQRRTAKQRMQSWTAAGRNVGVKTSALRTASTGFDDEKDGDDVPLGANPRAVSAHSRVASGGTLLAEDFQRPTAPRSDRVRADREETKAERAAKRRSASSGGGDAAAEPNHQGTSRHARSSSKGGGGGGNGGEASRGDRLPVLASATAAVLADNSRPSAAPRLTASEETVPAQSTTVELFEYQKKGVMFGWGTGGLPAACPPWQDAHGQSVTSKDKLSIPPGWRWVNEWHTVGGEDSAGWQVFKDGSNLRRRLWSRTMARDDTKK